MTFTEFGRRVHSNASYGTDHGTSTPVFIFGKKVKGQVVGDNPDLNDLQGGNMKFQVDYRQVYTSVLQDWFGASKEALDVARFSDFVDQRIDIFGLNTDVNDLQNSATQTVVYPNPASAYIYVRFFMQRPGDADITIFDIYGKEVYRKTLSQKSYGSQIQAVNINQLAAGQYLYSVRTKEYTNTGKLVVK